MRVRWRWHALPRVQRLEGPSRPAKAVGWFYDDLGHQQRMATMTQPTAEELAEIVKAMEHFRKKMRGDVRGEELSAVARLDRAIAPLRRT